MLDARVVDVDGLDDYLIDLLWGPFLVLLAPNGRTLSLRGFVDKLNRPERVELLRLLTLLAIGTTPASQLLGLTWNDEDEASRSAARVPPIRLWLYCLLRTSSIALRRYHLHLKKRLLQKQQLHQQLHQGLRRSASSAGPAGRTRESSSQHQRRRARGFPHDQFGGGWWERRQERACGVLHKLITLGRLLVLFWSVQQGGGKGTTGRLMSPNRYGLAALLSGNSYCNITDGDGDGDDENEEDPGAHEASDSSSSTSAAPHRHKQQRLHVNYAHRRWLWREGSGAAQLLWAGVLSSNILREAWMPLLRTMGEQCRNAWERCSWRFWRFLMASRRLVESDPRRLGGRTGLAPASAALSKSDGAMTPPPPPVCPLCGTSKVRIPVRASCGHVYCYACLHRRSLQASRTKASASTTASTTLLSRHPEDPPGDKDPSSCSSASAEEAASFRCRVCRNPITYAVPIPR